MPSVKGEITKRVTKYVENKAIVVLGLFMLALVVNYGLDKHYNKTMSNELLGIYQAIGTIIAAVCGSMYGSSITIDLTRRKEAEQEELKHIEASRWMLVILVDHLSHLSTIRGLICQYEKRPRWEIMLNRIFLDRSLPEFNTEELRFFLDDKIKNTNLLITLSLSASTVEQVTSMVEIWNKQRDGNETIFHAYFEANPDAILKADPSDEDVIEFSNIIMRLIGQKRTAQTISTARALRELCDSGISDLVRCYDELWNVLQIELPGYNFKRLDKADIEFKLGKKYWD